MWESIALFNLKVNYGQVKLQISPHPVHCKLMLWKSRSTIDSTLRWPKKAGEQDYVTADVKRKFKTTEDIPGSIRDLVVQIP